MRYLIIYLIMVNLVAAVLTVYDKWASQKRPRHRVAERTLFFWAIIGGAISIYLMMLGIRHKTQHNQFMWGLPAIIILQILGLIYLFLNFSL